VQAEPQRRPKEAILHLFQRFSDIGYRFREVAASKTLHMALPKLLVIWDNGIGRGYGLRLDAYAYAYQFIPHMRNLVNAVINDYMRDHRCDRQTAIKQIASACHGRTLAKLIDEYNWLKLTRRAL